MSAPARVLARIAEAEPWGVPFDEKRGHEAAERALTLGPWRQDWPFHCFYCSKKYSDHAHYPYCSSECGLYAEHD